MIWISKTVFKSVEKVLIGKGLVRICPVDVLGPWAGRELSLEDPCPIPCPSPVSKPGKGFFIVQK
jgi:hypothetical protein